MAQRGSFQIDDIRIAKKDNVFLMDIDATLDEPNQTRKLNITDVELSEIGTYNRKLGALPVSLPNNKAIPKW